MPTYQYRCAKCGEEFEVWQSIHDDAAHEAPGRAAASSPRCSPPAGIVLKGSGFYKTDNRGARRQALGLGETKEKVGEVGESKSGVQERLDERLVEQQRLGSKDSSSEADAKTSTAEDRTRPPVYPARLPRFPDLAPRRPRRAVPRGTRHAPPLAPRAAPVGGRGRGRASPPPSSSPPTSPRCTAAPRGLGPERHGRRRRAATSRSARRSRAPRPRHPHGAPVAAARRARSSARRTRRGRVVAVPVVAGRLRRRPQPRAAPPRRPRRRGPARDARHPRRRDATRCGRAPATAVDVLATFDPAASASELPDDGPTVGRARGVLVLGTDDDPAAIDVGQCRRGRRPRRHGARDRRTRPERLAFAAAARRRHARARPARGGGARPGATAAAPRRVRRHADPPRDRARDRPGPHGVPADLVERPPHPRARAVRLERAHRATPTLNKTFDVALHIGHVRRRGVVLPPRPRARTSRAAWRSLRTRSVTTTDERIGVAAAPLRDARRDRRRAAERASSRTTSATRSSSA